MISSSVTVIVPRSNTAPTGKSSKKYMVRKASWSIFSQHTLLGQGFTICYGGLRLGSCKGRWGAPHAIDDVDGEEQPGQICQQDHGQVRRGVRPRDLLAENDRHVSQHHRAIDDTGKANPLFSFDVGVN